MNLLLCVKCASLERLHKVPYIILRWPTTVTSNTNYSHQIQNPDNKYKLLTSKTNCSHQIQNPDIKHKLLTSNTQIAHIKYKSLRSKTRLNGQRSENENYVHFSTSFPGLFPLKLGGAGKDPGIGWSRDPS